jgi:hypothetical protein
MTLQGRRGKSPLAIDSIDDRYCRPADQTHIRLESERDGKRIVRRALEREMAKLSETAGKRRGPGGYEGRLGDRYYVSSRARHGWWSERRQHVMRPADLRAYSAFACHDAHQPHTRDHGRCGLCHPHEARRASPLDRSVSVTSCSMPAECVDFDGVDAPVAMSLDFWMKAQGS